MTSERAFLLDLDGKQEELPIGFQHFVREP
jgi:hypothetical protein